MHLLLTLPQFPHSPSLSRLCVFLIKAQPLLHQPTLATPRLWLDRIFLGPEPCVLRQPLITNTDSPWCPQQLNNFKAQPQKLRGGVHCLG